MSTQSVPDAGALAMVLCTFPNAEEAEQTARTLIDEGLCACVNILREVRSIYRWNGEVVHGSEVLCLLKTATAQHAAMLTRLSELHSYEVPEFLTLHPSQVNEPYLRWVLGETSVGS